MSEARVFVLNGARVRFVFFGSRTFCFPVRVCFLNCLFACEYFVCCTCVYWLVRVCILLLYAQCARCCQARLRLISFARMYTYILGRCYLQHRAGVVLLSSLPCDSRFFLTHLIVDIEHACFWCRIRAQQPIMVPRELVASRCFCCFHLLPPCLFLRALVCKCAYVASVCASFLLRLSLILANIQVCSRV